MLSLIAVLGFERTTYSVIEGEDLVFPFGMNVKGDIEEVEDTTARGAILNRFRGQVTTDPISQPGDPLTPEPEQPGKSL